MIWNALERVEMCLPVNLFFFFFNDTATTEIYTLSLHDALPIWLPRTGRTPTAGRACNAPNAADRKSTRLNSSHHSISYAVFCLKKKKTDIVQTECDGLQPKRNRSREPR